MRVNLVGLLTAQAESSVVNEFCKVIGEMKEVFRNVSRC